MRRLWLNLRSPPVEDNPLSEFFKINEVNNMKHYKLIGVVAVIGIGLWASTVHAQNTQSRTVQLDCIQNAVQPCGDGGPAGKVVLHLFQTGNSTSVLHYPFGDFVDGQPHPTADFEAHFPCQSDRTSELVGPSQFYVLYIRINLGVPIRIFSFNTHCKSWTHRNTVRLPVIGDLTDWFTEDLLVQMVLEADDAANLTLLDGVIVEGSD